MADIFEGLDLTPEQRREIETLRKGFFLYNDMVQDPETRLPLLRRMKTKYPQLQISVPEDDIAEPLLKPLKEELAAVKTGHEETLKAIDERKTAIEQIVEKFAQDRKDEQDVSELSKKIDAAARHYRFTDEGKAALVEHMKSTNTSDPMTAGAYLVQNMERPAPVTSNGLAPEMARHAGAPDVDLFQLATGQTPDDMKLLHSNNPKDRDRWMLNEVNKVLAESAEAA